MFFLMVTLVFLGICVSELVMAYEGLLIPPGFCVLVSRPDTKCRNIPAGSFLVSCIFNSLSPVDISHCPLRSL